jgi:hypothetical protein
MYGSLCALRVQNKISADQWLKVRSVSVSSVVATREAWAFLNRDGLEPENAGRSGLVAIVGVNF